MAGIAANFNQLSNVARGTLSCSKLYISGVCLRGRALSVVRQTATLRSDNRRPVSITRLRAGGRPSQSSRPGKMPSDIYYDPGYVNDEYDEEIEGLDEVVNDDDEEEWGDFSDAAYEREKDNEEDTDDVFELARKASRPDTEDNEDNNQADPPGFMPTEVWDPLDPDLHAQFAGEPIVPFTDYTPEELVDFSDNELTHEMTVVIEMARESCFKLWEDRLNWLEWFYVIHRMGIDPDNNDHAAVYAYYQWGRTPPVELYFVLERTECVPNERIVEESVKGMPIKGSVVFTDGQQKGTTNVTLSITYAIPSMLEEFVGPVGLYGDVNDMLEECLTECKDWSESQDVEEVMRVRKEDREYYDRGENPPGWDSPDQAPLWGKYYEATLQERMQAEEARQAFEEEQQQKKSRKGASTRRKSSTT